MSLLEKLSWVKTLLSKVPRKVVYLVVGAIVHGIAAKYPGVPLPNPDTIASWVLALLAAHTVTDVANLITSYFADMAKQRRDNGLQP